MLNDFILSNFRFCLSLALNGVHFPYYIFSGTVPITGLTSTAHVDSVQPFIEQNILKRGYRKAVKEFLDEKRQRIKRQQQSLLQSESATTAQLRFSRRLRGQKPQCKSHMSADSSQKIRITAPLRSSRRLRGQMPQVEVEKLCETRMTADEPRSNSYSCSKRTRTKTLTVKVNALKSTKPSKQSEPRSSADSRQKIAITAPLRSSRRLRGQMPL